MLIEEGKFISSRQNISERILDLFVLIGGKEMFVWHHKKNVVYYFKFVKFMSDFYSYVHEQTTFPSCTLLQLFRGHVCGMWYMEAYAAYRDKLFGRYLC